MDESTSARPEIGPNNASESTSSNTSRPAAPLQLSTAAASAPDQQRREALRKAGAEYLERALLQAKKTGLTKGDPFAPVEVTLPPLPPAPSIPRKELRSSSGRRRAKQQSLPEDVAAFGEVFESTKLYVYCGIYLACQATIYVLIKGSLTTMKTPGLMSFLHMASACLSFLLSAAYDIFDTRQVTASPQTSLLGCSVRAGLFGLQMLLLYGALLHSSVNMVLSWSSCVPLLVDSGLALATQQRSKLLSAEIIPLVAAATVATVVELVLDRTLSWLAVVLLLLWSVTKLAETGWRLIKEDPSLGGRLPGGDFGALAGLVRRVAEAEGGLSPPSAALLMNAVPALPVLLLGFVGQEVNEIIDHELSVPAVKLMLLSCVAHVGITWSQLLLYDRLSGLAKASLRWGALLGAVAFNFAEKTAGATVGTAICALAALGASAGASLQRHGAGRQLRPFEGLGAGPAGGSAGGGGGVGGAIDDDDDRDPQA